MGARPITITRSLLDGSLHIHIGGTAVVNVGETTVIHDREMPRWIPLRCGHYADTIKVCQQSDELFNNAGPNDWVSATCLECTTLIFSYVRASTIEDHGLPNLISNREIVRRY
jgi:hypothetical protein